MQHLRYGHQLDLTPFTATLWAWPSSQFLTSEEYTSPHHGEELLWENAVGDSTKGFSKVQVLISLLKNQGIGQHLLWKHNILECITWMDSQQWSYAVKSSICLFFFLADTLFSGGIVIKSSPSSNIHFEFQKSVTKHNLLFPNSM